MSHIDLSGTVAQANGRTLGDLEAWVYKTLIQRGRDGMLGTGEVYEMAGIYNIEDTKERDREARRIRAMLHRAEKAYGLLRSIKFSGRRQKGVALAEGVTWDAAAADATVDETPPEPPAPEPPAADPGDDDLDSRLAKAIATAIQNAMVPLLDELERLRLAAVEYRREIQYRHRALQRMEK